MLSRDHGFDTELDYLLFFCHRRSLKHSTTNHRERDHTQSTTSIARQPVLLPSTDRGFVDKGDQARCGRRARPPAPLIACDRRHLFQSRNLFEQLTVSAAVDQNRQMIAARVGLDAFEHHFGFALSAYSSFEITQCKLIDSQRHPVGLWRKVTACESGLEKPCSSPHILGNSRVQDDARGHLALRTGGRLRPTSTAQEPATPRMTAKIAERLQLRIASNSCPTRQCSAQSTSSAALLSRNHGRKNNLRAT
jgi:hypothetical protein